MRILLLKPNSRVARSGNQNTAERWAQLLSELGHDVVEANRFERQDVDLLIALHAEKTQEGLLEFRDAFPGRPCIVALTGTDLYPALSEVSLKSLEVADGLIVLQRKAIEALPLKFTDKVTVIIQSITLPEVEPKRNENSEYFDVCVVGHLREVKAPLLTARAARDLPAESKVRVRHAGGILEEQYREWVSIEEELNPRYEWLGELDREASLELIANSDLLVLTSVSEGGPAVVGEAIVAGTPVLSTSNDGSVGLLGDDFPGLFPVGNMADLTGLLRRCEESPEFYERLKAACSKLVDQFSQEREKVELNSAVEKALEKNGAISSPSSC